MNKQEGRAYLCLIVPPSFLSSVICENTAYLWFVETLASLILSHDQIFFAGCAYYWTESSFTFDKWAITLFHKIWLSFFQAH